MKTRKFLKQILTIIVIAIMILLLNTGVVNAALQANPNTQYTKTGKIVDWIIAFRQMETAGGAMGLKETLATDLTYQGEANNIDVHMMKSTEYGAIAILSASGYGNPSNDNKITTTTGNNTGMILDTSYREGLAGGAGITTSNANNIYYDTYTTSNTSAKIGDALGDDTTTNPGCAGWHSATRKCLGKEIER